MAATSSLLKSAESTRKKIRQQQDAEVAYQYQLSAKTYEDFLAYSKYLEDRQESVNNPAERLSYSKNINSARSGYISNEIQRQTISVMEGRSTNTDKYNAMVGLYRQAVDNGNYDLAQSLVSQLDSLSIRIQNEAEAGQRAAATMALNGVKSITGLIKKIQTGDAELTLADGRVVKPLSVLDGELRGEGNTATGNYWLEVRNTIEAIQAVVADAYMGATTQEAVDWIEEKYGKVLDGTYEYPTAAGKLTGQEVELAYGSSAAGNPLYSVATTRDETTGETRYKFSKNKVDDFVWVFNDDGTVSAVETRAKALDQQQSLDARINADGTINRAKEGEQGYDKNALSIRQKLTDLGYSGFESNDDGTFSIIDPEGVIYDRASIMPDGSVRFFGEPGQYSGDQSGLYEINLGSGGRREVAPDETSMFGTASSFGGLISSPTETGRRVAASLVASNSNRYGVLSGASPISSATDISGSAIPVKGFNLQGTSNLLQNAESIVKENRAIEAANILQQAQAFNLNQTPVQQLAQNNAPIRQLQVVKPATPAKISVAPPPKLPAVNVAPLTTNQGSNLQGGGGNGPTAVPRVKQPWEY